MEVEIQHEGRWSKKSHHSKAHRSLFYSKDAQWLLWMNGLALNESRSCLCYKITINRHISTENRYIIEETERENKEREWGDNVREIMKIRTRKFWITLLCSVADLMCQCRTTVEDQSAEGRWPGDNCYRSCLWESGALHILTQGAWLAPLVEGLRPVHFTPLESPLIFFGWYNHHSDLFFWTQISNLIAPNL